MVMTRRPGDLFPLGDFDFLVGAKELNDQTRAKTSAKGGKRTLAGKQADKLLKVDLPPSETNGVAVSLNPDVVRVPPLKATLGAVPSGAVGRPLEVWRAVKDFGHTLLLARREHEA